MIEEMPRTIDELKRLDCKMNAMFEETDDRDVRDTLAQAITVTRTCIFFWGEGCRDEGFKLEMKDAIEMAQEKIRMAVKMLNEVAPTMRSGDLENKK